jgi:hypothetical protein
MDLIIENLMNELSSEGNLSFISKSVGGSFSISHHRGECR